jgi:c-di-GMP-binding flagellar brake protein YcgR
MDSRLSARKYLQLDITLEIPTYRKQELATMQDISLGGAFIETQVLPPSDDPLIVGFKLPGSLQKSFSLSARVVHRAPRGVGVAFLDMSSGLINELNKALIQYEQQLDPFQLNTVSEYR